MRRTGGEMRQLTILSGAGINMGLQGVCPEADALLQLAYGHVSDTVYARLPQHVQQVFAPHSFDAILGGLITVNLAIENTKIEMRRFGVNEQNFADLFHQSTVQNTIIEALIAIERQLFIPLEQLLAILDRFGPTMDALFQQYDSINYYTVNFDAIFDHIMYGRRNGWRMANITDFWGAGGQLNTGAQARGKIFHLHGDLRFKPFKETNYNNPLVKWPVLVVGDQRVKQDTINSHDALRFYNQQFMQFCAGPGAYTTRNDLAIIGFGFRPEDDHIRTPIWNAMMNGTFSRIAVFDRIDHLGNTPFQKEFWNAEQANVLQFLQSFGQ